MAKPTPEQALGLALISLTEAEAIHEANLTAYREAKRSLQSIPGSASKNKRAEAMAAVDVAETAKRSSFQTVKTAKRAVTEARAALTPAPVEVEAPSETVEA